VDHELGRQFLALFSERAPGQSTPYFDRARIDWIFRGTNGIVRTTGAYELTEEFGDRNPNVSVPEQSVLRPFFNQSRSITALTHRMSLDLTLSRQ
jgi:hypothetical protein